MRLHRCVNRWIENCCHRWKVICSWKFLFLLNDCSQNCEFFRCKVLFCVDGFNSFYAPKTMIRIDDKYGIKAEDLSLIQSFFKFLKPDWVRIIQNFNLIVINFYLSYVYICSILSVTELSCFRFLNKQLRQKIEVQSRRYFYWKEKYVTYSHGRENDNESFLRM